MNETDTGACHRCGHPVYLREGRDYCAYDCLRCGARGTRDLVTLTVNPEFLGK